MLTTTANMTLPTALVGSIPRPAWYTQNLHGRDFKLALSDRDYREQYIDAVGAYIHDQEAAGLDILTDGAARFDKDVGGRGWFFYLIDRLGGFGGRVDAIQYWKERFRPGQILWEVMEGNRVYIRNRRRVKKLIPGERNRLQISAAKLARESLFGCRQPPPAPGREAPTRS